MSRKSATLMLLAVALCAPATLANDAPAASLVPQNAILVAQVAQPQALIDRAFDKRIVDFVKALPQFKEARANPG